MGKVLRNNMDFWACNVLSRQTRINCIRVDYYIVFLFQFIQCESPKTLLRRLVLTIFSYTPAIDYLHILQWVLGSIAYRNWMKSGQPRFNKKLEQYKMNCYFFTDFEFSFFDSQTVTIILWYETWKWNGYELWYHSSFSTNCFDVFDSTVFLSHLCWIINNRGWFRFYFC